MRILIVRPEQPIEDDLGRIVLGLGHEVVAVVRSSAQARSVLGRELVDLVLLDPTLDQPGLGSGPGETLRYRRHPPMILLTPPGGEGQHAASDSSSHGSLARPYTREAMRAAIQEAMTRRSPNDIGPPAVDAKGDRREEDPETAPAGLASHLVERVKAHVQENFHQDLRLDDLAELAGMSKFHFTRRFRQATGTTPYQYVQETRIDRAKALLQSSNVAISQIAAQVGFNSQSQFNRAFKKMVGVTPGQYRRAHR